LKGSINLNKCELLSPAGSLEKLKAAILYGADAVYIGGEEFSLRNAAENFTLEEMKEGISFAHARGKKVYVTANIIPHNSDLAGFREYVKELDKLNIDAIIISDPGAFSIVKEAAPDMEIHISTQANNVNYVTVRFWHKMGAKRVVLARELTLDEIREIRDKTPPECELEAFVHGAMCISYSGRCLLSNYMAGRDANKGECAHPCRWKYALVEEKRPGQYFPIYENERGTFILNSKDLCMINHIDKVIEAGIYSLKIEGRVKSAYYVATVTKAYREAIDAYYENPKNFVADPAWMEELLKVSHREYSTGFYLGERGSQVYGTSSYIRDYDIVGVVLDYDEKTKIATIEQRNRFFKGDEVEIIQPGVKGYYKQIIREMKNENDEDIDSAPHPQMILKIPVDIPLIKDSIIRKGKINE